jgi:hypothetical protein
MHYKDKILALIFDENENALFDWIAEQPVLEQVDILKEFKAIAQEMLAGTEDESQKEDFRVFEKQIDIYQETYLDEQLALLKLEMATDDLDKSFAEMYANIQGVRNYIKECIETDAPNATAMKEMAIQIIALEKQNGFYDKTNWLWFPHE